MGKEDEKRSSVMVNRAPVLTLLAAVVAGVLPGGDNCSQGLAVNRTKG